MTPRIPVHHRTPLGWSGQGGGRWRKVPRPTEYMASSSHVNGFYPFAAGSFRPDQGTPLGRDLRVGTAVAGDPDIWYHQGLMSSGTAMIFGLNGLGKSSFEQRLVYGMASRGITPAMFDPIKNEHGGMIQALGGTLVSIGPRSKDRINPLDLGALGEAAKVIGGELGAELRKDAFDRALDLCVLLVKVNRSGNLDDIEETCLRLMAGWCIDHLHKPSWADLVGSFRTPPEDVISELGRADAEEFRLDFKRLRDAVIAIAAGDLGHLIGGEESIRLPIGNKGGFCFDTSSISQSKTRLLSAAMLSTWQIGFSTIDAHWELAKYEATQAIEAQKAGDRYEPKVTWSGYHAGQDEFWFPMRHVPGIIDLADRLGRTNRGEGVTESKITHSPKDFLSLPNSDDREKARGFAQRSGMLALMALPPDDLRALSNDVVPLNEEEMRLISSFNTPPGWKAKLNADGTPKPPPGAGKVLLKLTGRVGIPIQMTLTEAERRLHVTDERSRRTAVRWTGKEFVAG